VTADTALIWEPPEILGTVDFLEQNYYLPDAGRHYSFHFTPYFLGVALALDDPEVKEIDLRKASQIGWTIFIIGYILRRIDYAVFKRSPIMGLFAKTGDAKNFHDEKLVEIVRANPFAEEVLGMLVSRKSGNRWDNKIFTGGFLKLVGSNSPGNVKSTSKVGIGFVEEPDDTQDNVAGQGDSIVNLAERLKRYVGSKLIVGGTPAVKGLSKTDARLKGTDQRVLPIVCHECGESHVLDWSNVIWDSEAFTEPHPIYGTSDPETAVYVCSNCGTEWNDKQRQTNIRKTCFDAYLSGDKFAGWTPTAPFYGKAGFQDLSELYVCMPGTSLADVVADYLAAEAQSDVGDESLMIAFINQKLGQSYEYKDDNSTAEELKEKAEDYPELIVPRRALILTIGIDVQRDRVAVTVYAWGPMMESWIIYFGEIWAAHNINDINDPVWSELDKLVFGSYEHEAGCYLSVLAADIDTSDGVTQKATYHYVRSRRGRGVNVRAIKGANQLDAPPVTVPRKMDLNATRTGADKYGLQLWKVGTQLLKDEIAGALKLLGNGPGRLHIYDSIRSDFFDQMTGEIKAPHRSIKNKLMWQPKAGQPIEAWDCTVYARHAAQAEKLHIKKPDWWQQKEAVLLQGDLLGDSAEPDNLVRSINHNPEEVEVEVAAESKEQPAASKPSVITTRPTNQSANTSAAPTMAELARRMGNH